MTDIAKVHDIEWYAEVPRSIRKQTIFGLVLLAISFGGFGGWAVTAPLASAIVAQGRLVATGENKVVQHYEGGIIQKILVNEGDHVRFDQPLIRLDETAARAKERELFLRRVRLEAITARLTAQIHGETSVTYPDIVRQNSSDVEVAPIIEGQNLNFGAWRKKVTSDTGLFKQNIDAYRFRIEGYDKQREALEIQLQLLRKELEGKQTLLKQGLIRNTEIMAIQRTIADATGQVGRIVSEISETQSQIIKEQQQIEQTENAARESALDELQSIQGDLDSVREQAREARSVLRRATINAPVAGTVIRMYYHTPGGVIESGKAVLEILPADVPLIIEAEIRRTEIDSVHVGEPATVRLTALNQRTTPVLQGEIFYVSADAVAADRVAQGQEFYVARVKLPPSELARIAGVTITPGMPVEVLIQTSERTFFSYITKPIADSMSRAFIEP
jgi:HlyD family secretion protein